ncbi:MAG: homoserine dehydrogenase [Candidatus Methanospirareceae archaeon]
MEVKDVKITIVGFGTVGKGVAEVIMRKREALRRKYGINLNIVGIVDLWGALVDEKGLNIEGVLREVKKIERGEKREGIRSMTALEVIEDVEHDVMVEATPTNIEDGEPGLSHILTAINSGRHVVTSNKGPLAVKYRKIKEAAEKRGVEVRFEATVGAAMPIISLTRETLAGNEILSIKGILNGTCNYILTRMEKEELPYEHVLKEAQEIGIAESDPSKDVLGVDTAAKLVILANSTMDMDATYKDVKVTGITEITPEALKLASDEGYVIKLIGEVDKEKRRLSVAPRLVPKGHPLDIDGFLNAALIKTDLAGDVTIIGRGAGGIEAASAILTDIIKIFS